MNFANVRNNMILDFNSKYLDKDIIRVETSNEIYQAYKEDKNKVIYQDGEIVLNPNYESELQAQEQARIQELSMTRSDFFDGTIMAWGVGQDELLVLIQGLLATLPLEDKTKLIAINNFRNALNFYRKHDLFKMLVGYPIPLNETYQITIMDEELDKFFDEVAKGNKATAWEHLPKPVEIVVEPDVDNSEPTDEENSAVEDVTEGEPVDNTEG